MRAHRLLQRLLGGGLVTHVVLALSCLTSVSDNAQKQLMPTTLHAYNGLLFGAGQLIMEGDLLISDTV